jgi:5-(carboxyamino)imidazole ribonucleotide synthase
MTEKPLLPGATIGVLGSGQLGRMLALEARRMGYRVHVLSPGVDTPTGQVADLEVEAPYEHLAAVAAFARRVDVVTFEFENVPARTTEVAAEHAPVRPAGRVLHTTQNRLREKTFLAEGGFPVAPFRRVASAGELAAALAEIGTPAVLKTAGWGYDGKGQEKIDAAEDAAAAWSRLEAAQRGVRGAKKNAPVEAVLEGWIDFEREVSVVAARGLDGSFAHYGLMANDHADHILDVSVAPAPVPPAVTAEAVELARGVFEALDVVGVACVEMFLRRDGHLLVNEIAPRPHNSGHLTLEAAPTSQFEQQLRAVCGLPLGATEIVRPAAMANLLGDLWQGGEPDWAAALAVPGVALHLYGKKDPRPGRKMGHVTALADTVEEARAKVLKARRALTKRA